MNYLIYLRKSRADSEAESVEETLAKHEAMLQETAARELGEPVPESNIYREVVSGETIQDRPMIRQLLSMLETGTVPGVLVVDPQRLTRGDLSDCGRIVNAFRYTGTKIITPQKAYDLTEKYDRKFFEMELMRGNDYLEYTKEILSRGRLASVKKGCFIAQTAPYGYRKDYADPVRHRDPTLTIDPKEAPAIRLMFSLCRQGMGLPSIGKELEASGYFPRKSAHWTQASIRDLLTNPVYLGKVRWNWRKSEKSMESGQITTRRPRSADYQLYDGLHEPLIDELTFKAVENRLGNAPRKKSSTVLVNPFSGLAYCQCGRALVYRTYYQKSTGRTSAPRMACPDQAHCRTRSVLYSAFLDRVVSSLQASIAEYQALLNESNEEEIKRHEDAIAGLRRRLGELARKDEQQHDLLEDGVYTKEVFLRRNKKLTEERQQVASSLEAMLSTRPKREEYRERIFRFSQAVSTITDPTKTAEEKNEFLKHCIKRITYHTPQTSATGNRWIPADFSLDILVLL